MKTKQTQRIYDVNKLTDRDALHMMAWKGDKRLFNAINTHAELLEAIQRVADEMQVWISSGDSRPVSWGAIRLEVLRKAIAKATGKE